MKISDTTKSKLIAAGKRALHTMAQAALGTIGAAITFDEVNWVAVGSAALLAGIISFLKSIVIGTPEVSDTNKDGEEINKAYDEEDGK